MGFSENVISLICFIRGVKCNVHGVIIEIWYLSCYFYLRNKSAKYVSTIRYKKSTAHS